ncbi:gamma carbonic anhydrase family protein [bacterium]|nr:gamma carbonic anhydrase family protein [bacterium]
MKKRKLDPHAHPEQCDESAFIADTATVVGNVQIGRDSSVWYGAVVRGDAEKIEIGEGANVQDLAVLHADPGYPCKIGDLATVGHAAVVHGAIVEEGALIGIRAVILNGAVIGAGAVVGAGALVPERCVIPPKHLALGVPVKVVRELTDDEVEGLMATGLHYVEAARVYRQAANETATDKPSDEPSDELV